MLFPLGSVLCDRNRRAAGKQRSCKKIWDNKVSAENSGREWSARFHSWLLQGLS